ncbi:MAG: F0F1 ATP synthase subunit delta [Methylococcaceae bacterium]|nr:F0F1 ATP synthase subunit delta [Methylococcaceae bacterium]
MSELATLARPYAVAAYKRAKQTASLERWSETLAFLAAVLSDPAILAAATNPKGDRERFTRSFLDLCEGKLDREGENFVRLLIANRRLNLIRQISEQFEQHRAEDEGYVNACVASAYPLDDADRQQVEAILRKTLGKQPKLEITVEPDLIGGVVIRAGDKVIDASVRGQLQRLAKRLH